MENCTENLNGKELMELLWLQDMPWDYFDNILSIARDPSFKSFIKRGDLDTITIACFNYGLMIGKQHERKKRNNIYHNTKSKPLVNREEILLLIEKETLFNNKLDEFIKKYKNKMKSPD